MTRPVRLSLQIHNGNLTNAEELRATLQRQSELSYQRHLRTDSDSEVLLNIFADEIHRAHKVSGCAAMRLAACPGMVSSCACQMHRSIPWQRSSSWCSRP